MSPREIRRAVQHAQAVVEDRRRWDGPSAEALAFVLDTHIPGDTAAAVTAALPASEGGTARDAESGSPDVAFRGALAALLTGNAPACQFLMGKLPDGQHRRYLLAAEIEETGQPADQRVQAWTRVLEAPGDDALAVQATAALAKLGHWPQQAEDMHDRGMLPEDAYQMLRAIWEYHAGDPVMGLARLRALADASVLAAAELVGLIEQRDGWAAAATECERQLRRWPAPQLTLRLLDLHGKNGNLSRAEELVRQVVPDPSFPASVRLDLCSGTPRGREQKAAWPRPPRSPSRAWPSATIPAWPGTSSRSSTRTARSPGPGKRSAATAPSRSATTRRPCGSSFTSAYPCPPTTRGP